MIYIIGNRISGRGKGAPRIRQAAEYLTSRGEEYTTLISEYPGHSTELARVACAQADCTLVAAVGGDGTFSEVLSGLSLDMPIAFIPAGTGNDFVMGAELPTDVEDVLSCALAGQTARYDILDVNGRRCLNVAGTGFDVSVLIMERKIRKVLPGKMSYLIALLITLITVKFTKVRIRVDGGEQRELPVLILAAANGRYYGGGMPISPDAECDDGLIDLVIVKKLPRIKIPYILYKFLKGRLKEVTKYVEVCRCKEVEFSTIPPVPVNIDGELETHDSTRVAMVEKAITVADRVGNKIKA